MKKSNNSAKRIHTIVGNRPNFIKVDKDLDQKIIHTGAHYDYEMSGVFFRELKIPKPDANLGIKGEQFGRMISAIRREFKRDRPQLVLVFGDTNSTLAGALAAMRENIPVAHIEAGVRSYRSDMPEEWNRVLTDRVATYKFVHAEYAIENLLREGIRDHIYHVGDVMFDAMNPFCPIKKRKDYRKYVLLTIHRQENADNRERLANILSAMNKVGNVVFPVHPRTKKMLRRFQIPTSGIKTIKPVGYKEMLSLVASAKAVVTDSGGLVKEAYWLGVPCLTLRRETEWTETTMSGWNVLVDDNPDLILSVLSEKRKRGARELPEYGAKARIREILTKEIL